MHVSAAAVRADNKSRFKMIPFRYYRCKNKISCHWYKKAVVGYYTIAAHGLIRKRCWYYCKIGVQWPIYGYYTIGYRQGQRNYQAKDKNPRKKSKKQLTMRGRRSILNELSRKGRRPGKKIWKKRKKLLTNPERADILNRLLQKEAAVRKVRKTAGKLRKS